MILLADSRVNIYKMTKNSKYRYFIDLAYDGTHYHGWQVQPNAVSVQQTVGQALTTLLKEDTGLTGTGRTDTEVHARLFTAHFDTHSPPSLLLEELDLVYKLNRILPPDISIYQLRQVQPDAHARFSAISRTYQYIISRRKDPFLVSRAWHMERPLDFDAMQQAASLLLRFEDFEAFSRSNTQVKHYRCKIMEAYWEQNGSEWLFHIKADRFLRNMVRAIVGTLTDVGRGKITLADMEQIIKSKNRSNAGYSVPGYGLYFMGAEFPAEIFVK